MNLLFVFYAFWVCLPQVNATPTHHQKNTQSTRKKTRIKKDLNANNNNKFNKIQDIQKIKQINVRAKKLERKFEEEDQKDISGFVTIISIKEKRLQHQDLSEVVRKSAGINIRKIGGSGSWSSISIRGSTSSQVQIFLDGIPLNHGGNGSINLADLPLDALRQVEIYRGFVPAHLGGAIGGALQLITRYPKGFQRTNITASFGSFGSSKINFYHGRRLDKFQMMLFATYRRADGGFRYFDDHGTPFNFADDNSDALRQNNAFDAFNILGKVLYQPKRSVRIQLSDLFSFHHQGIAGIGIDRTVRSHYQNIRNLIQLTSDQKRFPSKMMRWKNQLYFLTQHDAFADPDGEIGLGKQSTNNQTLLFAAKSLLFWLPAIEHEFSLSMSLRREGYLPEDSYKLQNTNERTRWLWTTALQYIASLFDERLLLTASGRLEMISQSFQPEDLQNALLSQILWQPTGRLGLRYHPLKPFWLKSNVGYYVRNPSFLEFFGGNGTTKGNPYLKPEKGLMWDIGGGLQLIKKLGFIEMLRLDYAFFLTNTTDIIRLIQNSQGTMIAVNISAAQILGHEIRLRSEIAHFIRLQLDFTWMDAINLSQASFEYEKKLPGRSPQDLSLQVELYATWGRLFYHYQFISSNFLDRPNLQELHARHLHNMGFSFRPATLLKKLGHYVVWEGLTITFEIKNLLNIRIQEVALQPPLPNLKSIPQAVVDFIGYPLQGRSLYLTVNWKI